MTGGVVVFGDETGVPMVLRALWPDKPAFMVMDPKREAAVNWSFTIYEGPPLLGHPEPSGRAEFIKNMLGWPSPKLGVICSYSRILWRDLIQAFPMGVVNLHGGKLPEYRGANVLQWAMINGEKETAVTLHYVDEGIDTGPVIAERKVSIEDCDTALTLREKLAGAGEALLAEWIPRLAASRVPAKTQDESRARAWPRRKPEDGLIDWSWPDEKIQNLTRALVPPWPGAFYTGRDGNKVVVDRPLDIEDIRRLRHEAAG
ncbi:MAG: hypothetical protein HZB29_13625 [Nitrospinae bacterium]|nr:hypothetical protein [Nitrospinota bacterium]